MKTRKGLTPLSLLCIDLKGPSSYLCNVINGKPLCIRYLCQLFASIDRANDVSLPPFGNDLKGPSSHPCDVIKDILCIRTVKTLNLNSSEI